MKSKLGIYLINLGGMDVVDYFSAAQPRIAVSMDHNRDTWKAIKQAAPNTFVIGRYYVDDPDQKYEDDPEGRAEQFFNLMRPDAERMRGVYDAWMSYNEIDLGKDANAPERARRLSRFHVRWGDLMKQAKLVSCAYSFATGNPAKGDPNNEGGNEPNLWPFLVEGLRHCDLLSLHEYSAPTMDNLQSWLCLRYRKVMELLPADARRQIVITETGIDGGPIGQAQMGWSKFTSEAGYLATLQWYDREMQKDDYVIGATIFAANGWGIDGSFGMGNVKMIRDYIAQGGAPAPVVIKPPTILSPTPTPIPSPVPTLPQTYTVQAGDTLSKIAKKFGVSVAALITANTITNPSLVRVGQVLVIPEATTALPSTPPPDVESPSETGWCPFAIKRPITTENFSAGRKGHAVKAVVLHIVAGKMVNVFNVFNNPDKPVSAHFCVGKDGTIEQYVSINDTAYGNGLAWVDGHWAKNRGTQEEPKWITVKPTWQDIESPDNPNLYTVSVEHDGQPDDEWTPAMYDANNRLLQWIAQQCNLTYVPHRTLIGHGEIDTVDKVNCPGPHVDYEQIAADANQVTEPTEKLTAIRAAARKVPWLPINADSALFDFAATHNLGCPQTDEFEFKVGGTVYVGQVFNLGICYVKKGDWSNVAWTAKPKTGVSVVGVAPNAAIAAAAQYLWQPINTDSALYKFAQANQLGCPQSDEFAFTLDGVKHIGQVFSSAIVYATKDNLSDIHSIEKSAERAVSFGFAPSEPSAPPTRRSRRQPVRRKLVKKASSKKSTRKTTRTQPVKKISRKTAPAKPAKKTSRKKIKMSQVKIPPRWRRK